MRISKKQLAEIVAYDMKARSEGEWDCRSLGSMTEDVPQLTKDIACVRPFPIPAKLFNEKSWTRKCLRYNYIVPSKAKDPMKRDVCVCHVAVKIEKKTNRPIVKVVAVTNLADLDNGGTIKIRVRDIGYHFVAGWQVYWDREDYKRKSINAWWISGAKGEWDEFEYKHKTGLSFPWHATINPEALLETRYRYCQYKPKTGVGLIDWLVLYRQDPSVELIAKVNLYQLICPQGLKAMNDKRVFAFVKDHMIGKEPKFRSSVREIVYAAKHGVSLQEAANHFKFVWELTRLLPRKTKRFCCDGIQPAQYKIDYERVRKQIGKWGIEKGEYARYISEAIDYGLDMKNEGTLYPPVRDGRKTFMERLERLESENQKRHRREERAIQRERRRQQRQADAERREQMRKDDEYVKRTLASRFKEIEDFQRGIDRIKHVNANGCTIVLAKTQEELRKEGRRMNNCVGGGTYGRGIVMGDTIIVMFKDAKGHSWCDAEISRDTWTVRQCYARGNSAAPEEIRKMASEIASELKKIHAKHRKDKAFQELFKRKVA